jgi:phosphate transport system protein
MGMIGASLQEEIRLLQENLLEMATCADTMVASAVESLMTGDLELMQNVVQRDDTVDRFDLDIESRCLRLIAEHQPVSRDLRMIGSALKVSTDIERIADYAVDIAQIGRRLAQVQVIYRPLVDFPRLSRLSRAMLYDALKAFIDHDLILVNAVIQADDAVDALYHEMRIRLTDILTRDTRRSMLALNLLLAANCMERIGDHVVNIAERVCFIATGQPKPKVAAATPTVDAPHYQPL